jgi:CRISPR system Cascade subunit CasE
MPSTTRHDVIMDAKTRLKLEKGEHVAISAAEVVQEQGAHWLISRAAKHGFDVDARDVRADGYLQHSLMNKQRRISFSTLDFNGVLTVIDPEKLIDALYHVVGPAKGFGCGLILVRRI